MESAYKFMTSLCNGLRERIRCRKYYVLAAGLLFLLEMALLVWPGGWLGEEYTSSLTGEGSWVLLAPVDGSGYRQEFVPQYGKLKSIGIVLSVEGEMPRDGSMSVVVTDAENTVLFEKEIPYRQAWASSYMDIEMNLSLNRKEHYFLSINVWADDLEVVPSLIVCSTEDSLPENIQLMHIGEVVNTELMTRYVYEDAFLRGKVIWAVLLCLLTAGVLVVGVPEDRRVRRIVGILLFVLGPYILGRQLELISADTSTMLPYAMKWNIGLIYLLEVVLLLCTQSIRFSFLFGSVFWTVLYSVNHYVFSYRGQFLRLNDFTAIRTAADVVDRYDLTPNSTMALCWCILVLFVIAGVQTGVKREKGKFRRRLVWHLVTLILGVMLFIGSGYRLVYTDMLEEKGFVMVRGFGQYRTYHFNGFIVAFLMEIREAGNTAEPEGYSLEKVEELLSAAEQHTEPLPDKMPHIIVVMNESFSDLRILGNLQISEENMSFFNGLTENTVRGYVNVSVLGGGTANSEFELFTGCSMGFLPASSYPYQQYIIKSMPSIVSGLEGLGYTTYSIHPAEAVNWNRKSIYQNLGFDRSLWIEDFNEAETLHYGVSDLETYRKVEELFENRQEGERMFLFDLTIQNHGGYSTSNVERTITATNISSSEADIYLSLIHESDRAFEQLVSYFAQQEEPVIICMYGDHQPKLSDGFYEDVYNQTQGLTEQNKVINTYKTPFVIWANYDIPEQDGMDIGMSYLGALLMDVAGVPCSPFFSFLQQYMEEYPIVTVNGYRDRNGNDYGWSGDNSELPEYRILQYNYLFDNNIVEWGFGG